MNRQTLWRILALAVVAIGIGVGAYQLGLTQGLAQSGQLLTAPPAAAVYMHGWHPWGHGFFFFPFFLLLITVLLLKAAFWGRRDWGYRCHGVPPAFDEWHRRAHEQSAASSGGPDPKRGRAGTE